MWICMKKHPKFINYNITNPKRFYIRAKLVTRHYRYKSFSVTMQKWIRFIHSTSLFNLNKSNLQNWGRLVLMSGDILRTGIACEACSGFISLICRGVWFILWFAEMALTAPPCAGGSKSAEDGVTQPSSASIVWASCPGTLTNSELASRLAAAEDSAEYLLLSSSLLISCLKLPTMSWKENPKWVSWINKNAWAE